jgi:glycosidase
MNQDYTWLHSRPWRSLSPACERAGVTTLAKPSGWWLTHPTLLSLSLHGAYDSNGDGLGDFEGLRQKLDFFLEAGISAYRLQHVVDYGDDPEWSGLVAQDWFRVDPRYGSEADFDELMRACAERDIKLITMAVPEYLGWKHPAYVRALEARAGRRGAKHDGGQPRGAQAQGGEAQGAQAQGSEAQGGEAHGGEASWFEWNDDSTVVTCWDRPAPDLSNEQYLSAFLEHLGFWMQRGIAGFDADAVPTWHNLTLEHLRRFTAFVRGRGGLVTAENFALEHPLLRAGGFNAGTGRLRHEYYNELEAIMGETAEPIRKGLERRQELLLAGMFPYQQFGDTTHARICSSWAAHRREMFKLQAAFNAALADQVWILAPILTFTERRMQGPAIGDMGIDWPALKLQAQDPNSAFAHLRRLFALRARQPELGIGHVEELETSSRAKVFAALRRSEDNARRALVVFNFSGEKLRVRVTLGDTRAKRFKNYLNGAEHQAEAGSLTLDLGRYGYKLLEVSS